MDKNSALNKNYEPQEWPSERIPHGGLFHTPKVEYSKETSDLIKLLMKEANMTMMMRKQVSDSLRNGEPLPKPAPPRIVVDPDKETLEILQRARNAKRKSLAKIVQSGAYELPFYRPPPDGRIPSEIAKQMLQTSMSGINLPDPAVKPLRKQRKQKSPSSDEDIINELLDQINDRADWLAEMEELGHGKKYRDEVREQIAERLRHIKAIQSKEKLKKHGFRYVD